MLNSKLRIAIIGANGQLGTDLVKTLQTDENFEILPLTHNDIEITDERITRDVFDKIKPNIIINTSAYHRVDDCETYIDKAFLVNATSQKKLSEYAHENNITIVYISTDYVFGLDEKRTKPYTESDLVGPLNVYGLSKLTGEHYTQYIAKKHFVVRSCGLFGSTVSTVKRGNFTETILNLAKEKKHLRIVNDQIVTPTYTIDLATQIHRLIKTENYGLFHATAHGECSWYTFAQEILRLTNIEAILTPVSTKEYPTPAKRPRYSVLENARLKTLGLDTMSDWKIGLKNYLIEKGYI